MRGRGGGNDSGDRGWRESEGPQEGLLKRGQGTVYFVLDKGDCPENSHVVFCPCPNNFCSFKPYICLDLCGMIQARETVKRYDDATSSLHNALSEQQEIDRRANEVGAQLVKNMDQLAQVKVDLKDLERKRSKQERLLKDINQVRTGNLSCFFPVGDSAFCLTLSLPRCYLKTKNSNAKFKILTPLFIFTIASERISVKTHSIKSRFV